MIDNILDVWRLATAKQKKDGELWYSKAHCLAKSFAPTLIVGAGVLAALSPSLGWPQNVEAALELVKWRWTKWQTTVNTEKALRILNGEPPLEVLGGLKVRAFYQAILSPFGDTPPVVDRHALSIYMGWKLSKLELNKFLKPRLIGEAQQAYREAARVVGVHHHVMQATTWLVWRAT